jgi:hypothetical protein
MTKYLVEMLMVKMLVDIALQRRKLVIVTDEAVSAELSGRELHLYDIVVPVQSGALMLHRKMGKLVRGGEVEFLCDPEHYSTSVAEKPAVAASQKSAS